MKEWDEGLFGDDFGKQHRKEVKQAVLRYLEVST
jgi:hypothetical protein